VERPVQRDFDQVLVIESDQTLPWFRDDTGELLKDQKGCSGCND